MMTSAEYGKCQTYRVLAKGMLAISLLSVIHTILSLSLEHLILSSGFILLHVLQEGQGSLEVVVK